MILTREKTEVRLGKLAEKSNFISITIPTSGAAQVWKDNRLDHCNYVLYDNGLLNYFRNGKVYGPKIESEKSRQVSFAGKNQFLLLAADGTGTFFSNDNPIEDNFSHAVLFEMDDKLVLIIADNNFSPSPRCFEFSATNKNLHLCMSVLYGVIAQRNVAAANQLTQWLRRHKHPLQFN